MDNAISLVGTIASLFGALISWKFASNAKQIADDLVSRFKNYREAGEISKIQEKIEKAISEFKKFGPAATELSVMGIDLAEVANPVQDLIVILLEHQNSFSAVDKKYAKNMASIIGELLAEFNSKIGNSIELRRIGSSILTELTSLSSFLKKQSNRRTDKALRF